MFSPYMAWHATALCSTRGMKDAIVQSKADAQTESFHFGRQAVSERRKSHIWSKTWITEFLVRIHPRAGGSAEGRKSRSDRVV